MKILLTAINAKYIHSNLAVYSLKANLRELKRNVTLKEYTINHQREYVLQSIFKEKPDVIVFSCYIWNIEFINGILRDLGRLLPDTHIWLGGPEVSYQTEEYLRCHENVLGVMRGEGEETFYELVKGYVENSLDLSKICGLTYRKDSGDICHNPDRSLLDMDELEFAYEDLKDFENRIIYYESSRGCPYSCAYCLSSVDKTVRFRSLEKVKKELQFFLDNKVPQIKFVDRTFNCKRSHTMGILEYIKEHDNGVTNFHFEVSADLLNEEELKLLEALREGLVQLEIGVQSANPKTLKAIHRFADFETLKSNVMRVKRAGNIHEHLDLIAGLPYEDYNSFGRSFDVVYAMEPEELQLGFLKVLKGAYLYPDTGKYGICYSDTPPYEVLYTNHLSYEEMIRLKQIEEMVEIYYNSRQFECTLRFMEAFFETPFRMYEALGDYYETQGLFSLSHSRMKRYEILKQFFFSKMEHLENDKRHEEGKTGENTEDNLKKNRRKEMPKEDREACFLECLVYDLYIRENLKNVPPFSKNQERYKEKIRAFYRKEAMKKQYLIGETYDTTQEKQLYRMTHFEVFQYNILGDFEKKETPVLFDYEHKSRWSHQAKTIEVSL